MTETGRSLARRVLSRVEERSAYATLALSAELDRSHLSAVERRLATELCYGVLRHQTRLDRAIEHYAHRGIGKLPVRARVTLRLAAYQLLLLDRIPAHAAVNDAVADMKRTGGAKLAGFANGLLRRLAREGEPELPSTPSAQPREIAAIACSMPEWLVDLLAERVGEDELVEAALGFQEKAPLWARVNRQRVSPTELQLLLDSESVEAQTSVLSASALRLTGAGAPDRLASFQSGLWTVQDLAAQVVGELMPMTEGGRYLDACAGVGGKTTHLAERLPKAHIDAVDVSPQKMKLLAENCQRLGHTVRTLVLDATAADDRLSPSYDGIVLDAPCTGIGVLRRHPERKWAGLGSMDEVVALQERLLDALAPRVANGGVLVYSVCSFAAAEGPKQVERFLGRHPNFVLERPVEAAGSPPWSKLLSPVGDLQLWPHLHGSDAFYAARLRAAGE